MNPSRSASLPWVRCRHGFTLLEVTLVIIVLGILLTLVVPSFRRVVEQQRLDTATQHLRSICSAERAYWLENRTFAPSAATLNGLGLIDHKVASGSDGYYTYSITAAGASTFTAKATRTGRWSGTITITETGEISGQLSGPRNIVLVPTNF